MDALIMALGSRDIENGTVDRLALTDLEWMEGRKERSEEGQETEIGTDSRRSRGMRDASVCGCRAPLLVADLPPLCRRATPGSPLLSCPLARANQPPQGSQSARERPVLRSGTMTR
jgi:hypothetical protein